MLQNREGQRVPNVTFRTRREHEWVDVTTDELFAGKTVVVFSLPGAFTPTCSSAHVPRYNDLADALKANGVDEIVCMSVNDGFVMSEWQIEQKADKLTFIPDGNGEFTAGMGLLVDKDDLGFGKRSWRYSMLVKDGVIVKQFNEPEVPGDPYEVSDADTMLDYINPNAQKPHDVLIMTKKGCPYCVRAKGMLREHGYEYQELVLGRDVSLAAVRAASGADTVPQVFIDGEFVGDSEALAKYFGIDLGNAA
jgi:glutaredoxin-like protein